MITFYDKRNQRVVQAKELISINYVARELMNPEELNPNNFKFKKKTLGQVAYKSNIGPKGSNWDFYCMKSDLEIYEITK